MSDVLTVSEIIPNRNIAEGLISAKWKEDLEKEHLYSVLLPRNKIAKIVKR
jgi:hypothetical protein